MVLWLLGYPEQARRRSQQALELAREPLHPFSLAYALMHATQCHWLRREAQATRAQAEATLAVATTQGFPLWEAGARIVRGWALAEQGQVEEGIGQLRHGIAAWQETGAAIVVPSWLAQLAEAYGQAGQIEEGLATLTTASATIKQTGERWWEAEVHRLHGEFILQKVQVSGSPSQSDLPPSALCRPQLSSEACFLKAIEIARRQQAKSLELRAVVSLSRLWQKQGKKGAAHKMLAEIYGWFAEGLEAKDLQEAEALLAQLA
jgi:predicted ATPase